MLEIRSENQQLRQRVADRLVALLTDPTLTIAPSLRLLAAGDTLAQIGDPRTGVGVKNGLPDIAWSDPIPAGNYPTIFRRLRDCTVTTVRMYHIKRFTR